MNNLILIKKNKKYFLNFKNRFYECIIGRSGLINTKLKTEGDGATPRGNWELRNVWYREDRIENFSCNLPLTIIEKDDGWCDDPKSPDYNKNIKLPSKFNHEKLFRDDNLYDILITIGYNDFNIVPDKGSAIFIHCRNPDKNYTEGCIGLWKEDLIEIFKNLKIGDKLIIK